MRRLGARQQAQHSLEEEHVAREKQAGIFPEPEKAHGRAEGNNSGLVGGCSFSSTTTPSHFAENKD